MTIVYLDELVTEKDVLNILPELQNIVIEAVCAERGKKQKVTQATVQVKQLMKKCGVNRWDQAKKQINQMFGALEREAAEYASNIWNL
jgi:hypothetical protein